MCLKYRWKAALGKGKKKRVNAEEVKEDGVAPVYKWKKMRKR